MAETVEMLENLECPFNWRLEEISERQPASQLIQRLTEREEDYLESWRRLTISLNMAYLHAENKEYHKAADLMKAAEDLLTTSADPFLLKYKEAFNSVYYASKACLALKTSSVEEFRKLSKEVIAYSKLDKIQQSGVLIIKANILLDYGFHVSSQALEVADEALRLNPEEGEVHFVIGKLLSRRRHFYRNDDPSDAEIRHFQIAHSLIDSPISAFFLSMAYLEKAKNEYIKNKSKNFSAECNNDLRLEGKKLIMYALEKNGGRSLHLVLKCAFELVNLPYRMGGFELARELLSEVIARSPTNSVAHKQYGDLCRRMRPPAYEEALKHFEVAASRGVFSADMAILEIKLELDKILDPQEEYSKLLEKHTEHYCQRQILIHALEFYSFVQEDLFIALDYFLRVVALDPEHHHLFARYVKCIKREVNFYEFISDEARKAIKNNRWRNQNQLDLLKKTLNAIETHQPQLMQETTSHSYYF